jgi:hypothetical protein
MVLTLKALSKLTTISLEALAGSICAPSQLQCSDELLYYSRHKKSRKSPHKKRGKINILTALFAGFLYKIFIGKTT